MLSEGSEITLTNNEIKYIIKVTKSLDNRGILLKGTTRKITSQEGGFLNFLRPLMAAVLPLMKNVLTPLAKSVLIPLGLSAGMPAANAAIQKKIYGSGTTAKRQKSRQKSEHMLPEPTFMKGYRTLCVSIKELQINYKVSFKEVV